MNDYTNPILSPVLTFIVGMVGFYVICFVALDAVPFAFRALVRLSGG